METLPAHVAPAKRVRTRQAALRFALRSARLLAVIYLVILLAMLWLENSKIYFPLRYSGGAEWETVAAGAEDAWFESSDGTRLHGWYFAHPQPQAVVLFMHGNAGNVLKWSSLGRGWRDRFNVSILVFDYRGYGRSEGAPSEPGLIADARAARKWLADRNRITQQQVVLLGRSIGGGVAVDLATDGARGLILERTFSSLPDVAASLLPWLPVRRLMRNRYDSLAKIGRYHGPLLMSHGDRDTIVPMTLGRKLFAAANEPKQWFTEPGGGHNDPQSEVYLTAVRQFLADLPASS